MSDRFGTNSSMYDLSRLMTFATGLPAQNTFSAPIILDNPSITSGAALFSHTPQPFTVAVAAASELSLFDLNFANTGAAGTQFYGIKIQSNSDVVDTGAGIALFNLGRADAVYIDVAGKSGNPAGNNPTGIGIDVNKEPASGNERASANSSQQGMQIWDHSLTDQGVGGPRCLFLNKFVNTGTHHFLATIRGNTNLMQFVVISGNGEFTPSEPAIRFDDEDTGVTWWKILSSGEQVFNKDGIGIQWITPGAKTAYILASTNDLKLKSGGTGVRFVNQADTQTIVMMQDDLSVDIPNNEVRFKALKIVEDRVENYITNALASVSVNYNGYNGGTTQFRDFKIFDGKQNVVAEFTGTSRNFLFATATDKTTTLPQVLISGGVAIWHDGAGALNIGLNAWHDGTNLRRLTANNTAGHLYFSRAGAGAFEVYFNTDAGNTVDSVISESRSYHFGPTTIGFLGTASVNKPTSTADLRQALIDMGLYTTGGASPLNLNGGLLTAARVDVSAATPLFHLYDSSAAANEKYWRLWGNDGTFVLDAVDDAYTTASAAIEITRSGNTPALTKINSLIYGSMYADNISQSVTIAATDTHVEVGGSISGGNTNGVTFQNSKELKILSAGVYLITYSISVQCANANQEVEASVMVNSTESVRLSSHALVTPANTPNVLAGSQAISLSVNDVVKFCVANHTATNNLTVSHANMSIVRIGA